jgi:hypothetical protein
MKGFEEIFARLAGRDGVPLRPSKIFDKELGRKIEALDAGDEVKAGLYVLNDDLERAHELAQAHEGDKTCDYWHAIVHRREGDFDNAKYWLRQVGRHPVLSRVHDGGPSAALAFVDRCRDATPADRPALEAIQKREILGLIEYARGPTDAVDPKRR